MEKKVIKEILLESNKSLRKTFSLDLTKPFDYFKMLSDENSYEFYKESLLESFSGRDKMILSDLIDSEAESLLESVQNAGTGLPQYEVLRIPLLTVFWPKFIGKELVTVDPIYAPEVIRPFLRPYFVDAQGNKIGDAPSYDQPSYGPSIKRSDNKSFTVGTTFDILGDMGLTVDTGGLQRNFKIWQFEDTNQNKVKKVVVPGVNGDIDVRVVINGQADRIVGKVDYDAGTVLLFSENGVVTKVYYEATAALEKNMLQKRIKLGVEKVNLRVEDQEISAEWTVQLEQDLKALYDVDFQAKVLEILGKQMAMDIDSKIINNLLDAVENQTDTTKHKATFDRNPPSGYSWGPLYWYRNVIDKLAQLSSVVYADTNIGEANTLAINPVDSSLFVSLQDFSYNGDNSSAGSIGYQTGTLNSKWKVLISNIVPQGKAILVYKSPQALEAVYFFGPYKPATLLPHPLGHVPSFSILSRNAHKVYRPNGIALLEITDSTP